MRCEAGIKPKFVTLGHTFGRFCRSAFIVAQRTLEKFSFHVRFDTSYDFFHAFSFDVCLNLGTVETESQGSMMTDD